MTLARLQSLLHQAESGPPDPAPESDDERRNAQLRALQRPVPLPAYHQEREAELAGDFDSDAQTRPEGY